MTQVELNKTDEIYSLVDNSSQTILRLLELSTDEDWFVREQAIEKIGEFGGKYHFEESIRRIRAGIFDEEKLVRSTCILVLGDWQDIESLDKIVELLMDDDCIVRIAAAEAVGWMGDVSKVEILESLLETIEEDNELVFFYFALLLLGQEKWMAQILDLLNSDCYRTRCATANSLIDLATEQNKSAILESLKQALAREETIAARSTIENAIKVIETEGS